MNICQGYEGKSHDQTEDILNFCVTHDLVVSAG